METSEKRIHVRLVDNAQDYKKYLSKPCFVSQKIFSITFVAIHGIKPVLTLDKPIYVGFNILDLSKYCMYDFHYSFAKKKHNVQVLFTDTVSLVYEIKTDDVFQNFYKDKYLFNLSNYPKDSKFYYPGNEKVIGKMKDEP